ncbi:YuzF family protein [Paenibacillus gansuensis]|uniref:YuzF family protein n=1 Tax=Paenibacillus gansuensis TaxID=306542 RepID=A0ABW5PFY1_9BACL
MSYDAYRNENMATAMPQPQYIVEPFVFQTLSTVIGKNVALETPRGIIRGTLKDVKPDHIVVQARDSMSLFFIRIQQIIWITPEM